MYRSAKRLSAFIVSASACLFLMCASSLVAQAPIVVNGVTKDGSGGGWPLYSKIVITAGGFPGATIYSDPVTGYYSIPLPTGNTYHFAVTAVSPGYLPGSADVPVGVALVGAEGAIVQNFDLLVDPLQGCRAPGYSGGAVFADFSSGTIPPGWSLVTTTGGPWSVVSADPCGFFGNNTGGTGPFAVANSNCDGFVTDDNELRTPVIDLSSFTTATLQWDNDYFDFDSIADVDISIDGGTTWNNVWRRDGEDELGPDHEVVDITALATGHSAVQARFHYYDAFFAWWWQVDNVVFGSAESVCSVSPGGLVVGTVSDANTGLGLNGATVTNLPADGSTTTFAANAGDGFYILFAASGSQPFEASKLFYSTQQKSTVVIPNGTVRLDFSLDAGRLNASPRPISSKVDPGASEPKTLTLSNTGGADANFTIFEIGAPLPASSIKGPFATDQERNQAISRIASSKAERKNFFARSTEGFPALPGLKNVRKAAAGVGDVISSFDSGLGIGWGVGFDNVDSFVWISNPTFIGAGDDLMHSFTTGGTDTGNTIDVSGADSLWMGDVTFNTRIGTLWGVNVGGDNCLAEMNPSTLALTGNEICGSPWSNTSQRGVAYDGATNTYYVGGWNDLIVYHIDGTGAVLDSKSVGLSISGLAYDSTSGHLLVISNDVAGNDITVLDPANDYAVVDAFQVLDNGSPAFDAFQQAGMDIDCSGNLWAINQGTQVVYQITSGEPAFPCTGDVPWVSEDPTSGTVTGNNVATGTKTVAVTFDSTGLFPGLRQAQLQFGTDTPYQVAPVGLNFTVRFLDVADNVPAGTDPYENFIYAAAGANIMHGCSFFDFCPHALVTRADMAGYIERSVNGAFTPPPVYTGIFSDVFFGAYNADYIQGAFDDGITVGCQGPGAPLAFCPTLPIPRGQMAVFIEKGVRGGSFAPPICTTYFTDVPCPPTPAAPYGNFIQQLFIDGITAGCNLPGQPGYPKFCPDQNIPNEQMAAFLVKAFGFPVLP